MIPKRNIMDRGFEAMLSTAESIQEEEEIPYTFYNEIQFILFGFEFSMMLSLRRMPVEELD